MTKLIYVASGHHSGSTMLDMLLSAHRGICGLGEVFMMIDDASRTKYLSNADNCLCSCGQSINHCQLWQDYFAYVKQDERSTYAQRYQKILSLVHTQVGPDTIVVDSSKYTKPLGLLHDAIQAGELPGVELFVIHLVKDARSFAVSMKRRFNATGLKVPKTLLSWYRFNREMHKAIADRGIPCCQVGYEELCFNPRLVLEMICEQVGVAFDEQMLDMSNSKAHIGVGNSMRTHAVKSKQIVYDCRWFHETDIAFWYFLLGPILRSFNRRAVYQHLLANHTAKLFEPRSSAGSG